VVAAIGYGGSKFTWDKNTAFIEADPDISRLRGRSACGGRSNIRTQVDTIQVVRDVEFIVVDQLMVPVLLATS
jgi:hypothetical protein